MNENASTLLQLWRITMRARRYTEQEQYEIIMKCRQSGLSDHQWCLENDINPGTFYNWVSRFRKKACEFPASARRDSFQAVHQEVVKMQIIPDQDEDLWERTTDQNISQNPVATMEVQIGQSILRTCRQRSHI